MTIIHIYTFSRDEDILRINLQALEKLNAIDKIVLICDGNARFSDDFITTYGNEYNIEIRYTSWNRAGNLNGQPAILGILGELYHSYAQIIQDDPDATREANDSTYIKLDSDTLIRDDTLIQEFNSTGAEILYSDDRNSMYGCFYALKGHNLWTLLHSFINHPTHEIAQEDIFIGSRARNIIDTKYQSQIPMYIPVHDELGNGPHGQITAYSWSSYPHNTDYYHKYPIVTFGNRRPNYLADRSHLLLAMTAYINPQPQTPSNQ